MSKRRRFVNPFYVALVLVGTAFVITACGYGVMAVKESDLSRAFAAQEDESFVRFFDEHGATLLIAELAALGALTLAAIATDEFWSRRGASK